MAPLHVPYPNVLCVWDILPSVLVELPWLCSTIIPLHNYYRALPLIKEIVTACEPLCIPRQ